MQILKVFLLLILYNLSTSWAATYYVDAANGNDANSGTSSSLPWKTVGKINSRTFSPGDVILFKRGSIWREQINFSSSGTSSSAISISTYGSGNKPIISGADLLTGFVSYTTNVWKKSVSSPQQVFFNGVRGNQQSSLSNVNSDKEWYYSSGILYIYSAGNPSSTYTSPGIEKTSRSYGFYISSDYVKIDNFQVEKTSNSGIKILSSSQNVLIDNITMYQWTTTIDASLGGISIYGSNCEVRYCTLGKKTGDNANDQRWAGFVGILIEGASALVHNNNIYHNSIETESTSYVYATGIIVTVMAGTTKIYDNYLYHIGSHGISIKAASRTSDRLYVYNNRIEYPGLSGISAFKTRGSDGIGGIGYIYNNDVSYADRLGGQFGSASDQASGIHFNDGEKNETDPAHPYIKWYCYENIVHNSASLAVPNSPDAGGISLDFNANRVEVYRNLTYNNNGKGIYIWNANYCKIFDNIIYGNDAGTSISANTSGVESANYNEIYNNTYYKNYNGSGKGPNLNSELWLGPYAKNNVIKNNTIYGAADGFWVYYYSSNCTGNVFDYTLIYRESGGTGSLYYDKTARMTLSQWQAKYTSWDDHSISSNPLFVNTSAGDFNLQSSSPAINKGVNVGISSDYYGKTISGNPDIGAVEYGGTSGGGGTTTSNILLYAQNATLANGAAFKTKTGSKGSKVAYCSSSSSTIKFTVNIPSSGTWYAWGRLFYEGTGNIANSFFIDADNGTKYILGNNNDYGNTWYWGGDGNKYTGTPVKLTLGYLASGQHTITISGRETGSQVMVDMLCLTNNADLIASDANLSLLKDKEFTEDGIIIDKYDLLQNFPNPFNPSTKIKYSIPENTLVTLKVYDILGKEIATLVNKEQSIGSYEVVFDASSLSSGVYIYILNTKNMTLTKKMQFIK